MKMNLYSTLHLHTHTHTQTLTHTRTHSHTRMWKILFLKNPQFQKKTHTHTHTHTHNFKYVHSLCIIGSQAAACVTTQAQMLAATIVPHEAAKTAASLLGRGERWMEPPPMDLSETIQHYILLREYLINYRKETHTHTHTCK
eukprot:GHVR01067182.1.p1 GENE.GHVR01067182.1~~GHVR01067182.1.p1  ORF type:complete len:142 (+),score=84.16 GHVR01067182.1:102-527(+)